MCQSYECPQCGSEILVCYGDESADVCCDNPRCDFCESGDYIAETAERMDG